MIKVICFFLVANVPLIGQSGYLVHTEFQVRACSEDCAESDNAYERESAHIWNEEKNRAMEGRLSEQLRDHLERAFKHWPFFTGETEKAPVTVRVSVEDEGDDLGIHLVLSIQHPQSPDPVVVHQEELYKPGHFVGTTIDPLPGEEAALAETLSKIFVKKNKTTIEDSLKAHIPIALSSEWVERDSGRLAIHLERAKFEYLGRARFKLWMLGGNQLISESNLKWCPSSPGHNGYESLMVLAKSMISLGFDGPVEAPYASLTPEQRETLQVGAIFLDEYLEINSFAVNNPYEVSHY